MPRGETSDCGFPGFSTTGICQKVCVSCRRASRKTVTTGHTLETSRRKMPKIFSTLPPFRSNVCTPNLSVFGLLRSGDVKEGILMHNKGVKLSILRHHGPCVDTSLVPLVFGEGKEAVVMAGEIEKHLEIDFEELFRDTDRAP